MKKALFTLSLIGLVSYAGVTMAQSDLAVGDPMGGGTYHHHRRHHKAMKKDTMAAPAEGTTAAPEATKAAPKKAKEAAPAAEGTTK